MSVGLTVSHSPAKRQITDDGARGLIERALRQIGTVGRAITLPPKSRLSRLSGVVLLSGGVGSQSLASAVGRSVLDLPLGMGRTVAHLWRQQITSFAADLHVPVLPCRVIMGVATPAPAVREADAQGEFVVEQELRELRGTGGLLRDLVDDYPDDACLIVGNAGQMLLEPLSALAAALDTAGGDLSLIANADGTPSSLMLLRAAALRDLPNLGFVDLKEQGLAQIARRHEVTVVRRTTPTAQPIRTLAGYIAALRTFHRMQNGGAAIEEPFAERWQAVASIVEPGAEVHESARLHDSVVLAGGRVERDATVVRSVVCAGGIVPRRRVVTDQVVARR